MHRPQRGKSKVTVEEKIEDEVEGERERQREKDWCTRARGCCSMWLNKRRKRCDTGRIWSAANELGVKTDSFAEETDLNITSRGFMTRVWKTDREEREKKGPFQQVVSSYMQPLKTYFPWSKRGEKKSIDGVRNLPRFQADRLFKTDEKIIYLEWRYSAWVRSFCSDSACVFSVTVEKWKGVFWQKKNAATLWNVSHGRDVCWRRHLLCMIMKRGGNISLRIRHLFAMGLTRGVTTLLGDFPKS